MNVPECGQLLFGMNMVFSDYTKQRIVFYYHEGLKPPTISSRLSQEGINASKYGIYKFLKNYKLSGSIVRRPGNRRSSKITDEVKHLVEEKMREDDETTAMQLHQLLAARGYSISKRTTVGVNKKVTFRLR